MINNINLKKSKNHKFSTFRIFLLFLSFIILGFIVNIGINSLKSKTSDTHSSVITDFYSKFNNCDFDEAENLILTNYSSDYNNNNKLTKDLNSYFTGVINKVCSSIASGEITDYEALTVLTEIKKYNILNSSLDKLIASIDNTESATVNTTINDSGNPLYKGIDAFNNKEYSKAISYLASISESNNLDYKNAKEYIIKCKTEYKNSLFSEADILCAEDYYTKAIELLTSYDTNILGTENKEISDKINSIRTLREQYLNTIDK